MMGKRFSSASPLRIFVETTGSAWGGCLLSPPGLDEPPLTRGHRRYIFEILHHDLSISSSIIQAEIKTEAEGGPLVSDPLVRRCGALEASKQRVRVRKE